MTRAEYLKALGAALRKQHVADVQDILSEYDDHFVCKLADGYSEEEISARLGDPAALAAQFAPNAAAPHANKALTVTGLCFADVFAGAVFVLLAAFALVLAAFALISAATAMLRCPLCRSRRSSTRGIAAACARPRSSRLSSSRPPSCSAYSCRSSAPVRSSFGTSGAGSAMAFKCGSEECGDAPCKVRHQKQPLQARPAEAVVILLQISG